MKKSNKPKPLKNKKRKRDKKKVAVSGPVGPTHNPTGNANVGMDLVAALKIALEHQNANRPEQAEKFYRKALEIDPGNSIATQLLGRLAQLKGDDQEAVELFAQAVEKSPDNAEIRNNLGNSLSALENFDEAIRHLEKAVELDPDYAIAHNNLGAALTGVERLDDAITQICRSLELRPDNASAHNNLGNALEKNGQFDESVTEYNQAIRLQPEFPDAYYNLGVAFEREKLFGDAIDAYKVATAQKTDHASALYNLGNIYMNTGDFGEARGQFDKALEAKPAYAEAHNNMGIILKEMGLLSEAEESWRAASAHAPNMVEADSNLGNVLRETGRFEEAVHCYEQAIAAKPDYAAAYNNLGIMLSELDRLDEAETNCRRAIELDENFADAHRNLALVLFMKGDVSNGWEEYEWRSEAEKVDTPARFFPQPQWQGESLDGKSILLWGEQGLGDETRYASMIPDMLEKGADVSIECTPRLVSLFRRSFPQATVYTCPFTDGESGKAHFDFQCPFPSLGRALRPTVESFASQQPGYLKADPARIEFWLNRLSEKSSRPKIGINWRSLQAGGKWDHFYARIEELAPIMAIQGVEFVNLMYDATADELAEFERLHNVTLLNWDDIDMRNDIDEVAALNSNLDMVVSCLSSVSEMSGALGVPTMVFIGEKRNSIMLGTGDAVWYSGAKYFTKNRDESWQRNFREIAQKIQQAFDL